MQDKNDAIADTFRTTTDRLTQLLDQFDDQSFNRKPAGDKWSAGEVAEHLLIFDVRLNQILENATHHTDRDVNEKVPTLTARVSDRNNKIEAPEFLLPSPDTKSRASLVEKIRNERNLIVKAIKEQDLSLHNKLMPHRFFGEMTATEWIRLVDVHTNRHIEQLTELLEVAD